MSKYIVFYKDNKSKFLNKDSVSHALIKDLKQQGYKKHHVEVEAESESEAKVRFNEFNSGYLDSLRQLSGSAVICAVSVIVIAIISIIRFW
ncbi:hypothetical protein QMZ30_12545 [Pantoea sp. EA-12]|uniref:hypothetical protein n=1 Tax=Pantoea sp. EA-12 TaxID=3043303 RepID=UPI0024B4FE85|nr:hypothetical protein [Pantoea sp. EA-12]MDI9221728.1 hypothetical protein [Pantoea sp. EA-12]